MGGSVTEKEQALFLVLKVALQEFCPPSFCTVDIRSLAPLIFQVMVADARHDIGGKQPTLFRNDEGCVHSIVRRTNAPHRLAVEFVDKFTAANYFVDILIRREIVRNPYRNYFP